MASDPRRWSFSMAAVLAPDDAVAQFLVALGMCLNDLVFVSRLQIGTPSNPDPLWSEGENQYLLRLGLSHLCELLETVREGYRHEQVHSFVNGLSTQAQRAFGTLLTTATAEDDVHKALYSQRNGFFHYPAPGQRILRRAMQDVADSVGVLVVGDHLADYRAEFADLVATQYWSRTAKTAADLSSLFQSLSKVMQAALTFTVEAIDSHFASMPPGTVSQVAKGA